MRHGQTWLISHQEFENTPTPCVKTGATQIINTLHVIIDPNIFCMFWSGNSRFCTTLLKIQTFFSEFQGSENPPKCPKLWSLDFLGPASEAPGHTCPWRPPRRLCSAKAPPPRRGRSTPRSAAAFGLKAVFSRGRRPLWPKPRETTKVERS